MKDRIIKVMAKVFKVDESLITEDAAIGNIEGWDSLNHMNLIAVLENEFDIEIDGDEYEEMVNFKIIYAIIESYLED